MRDDRPTPRQYAALARAIYCNNSVEIDDYSNPKVSYADNGAWVQAWVWVSDRDIPVNQEEQCKE